MGLNLHAKDLCANKGKSVQFQLKRSLVNLISFPEEGRHFCVYKLV